MTGNLKIAAIASAAFVTVLVVPTLDPLLESPRSRSPETRVALPADRPNIILIVTDDQREGTLSVMRATRRLFKKRGVNFDPAFASTPMCCPARASLFSGRYMHNHGVRTNTTGSNLDQDHTVQAYLQDAGYRTALFGKFLNTFPEEGIRHFDRWAMSSGFHYRNGPWNVNGEWTTISRYATEYIQRKALGFIQGSEAIDDTPWFLYLAPIAPHGPAEPQRRYADAEVPPWNGNPRVSERDRSDKPPYIRAGGATLKNAQQARAAQMRTLMSVDDLVGRLFRSLKANEERNTLAFFISDNGMHWAEHGWGHKTTPYGPSVEVPFMMRWPGKLAGGTTDDRFAAHVDVAPTILDAARIPSNAEVPMDGRSLLQDWRRKRAHLEYRHYRVFSTPSWASTRTRRWQYMETYEDGRITFREFYRLRNDPWQLRNVLRDDDPGNDPDLARLHRRLRQDRSCAGTSCP